MQPNLLSIPLRVATWLMGWWVRPDVLPNRPAKLLTSDQTVLYVLEVGGLADRAALNIVCRKLGLPEPTAACEFHDVKENSSVVILRRVVPGLFRKPVAQIPPRMTRLIEHACRVGSSDLQIVPVAIYWGRSPAREDSLLKQMFSENWRVAGRTTKFFKTIVHGRYTLVQFSQPLSLVPILKDESKPTVAVRKVSRILRVHFRQRRIATLGPDLSHRRTLIDRVLINPIIRNYIKQESGGDSLQSVKLRDDAARYAHEIAADISYSSVRVLRTLLTRLWNKLYDGVRLDGLERVHSVAEGRELVYVPCHRSHIDYLLLSYALHMNGMSLPHIAAGINLNLPIIGSLLRRGGAFFLRRSFKGNKLYSLVFNAYLQEIIQRGHSLEYFVEGGRSRTGRLLNPRAGMLAMTAQSYIKEPTQPIMFVPIYFGYERLVEGGAFASELTGAKKEKETLLGLLRSFRLLRQEFGSVYVNFGLPIDFTAMLDEQRADWRQHHHEERPQWLNPIVDQLGTQIMQRINCAASITPIGLLSFALLTTSNGRIASDDLQRIVSMLQLLHDRCPYSPEVVITCLTPAQIVEHGIELNYIHRRSFDLGGIVEIRENQAIPLSFFRNNILHIYSLPGCVASCFVNQAEVPLEDVQRIVKLLYPYLKNELFLHWLESDIDEEVSSIVSEFVAIGLLRWRDGNRSLKRPSTGSRESFLLRSLGHSVTPSLQRYYLTASLLSRFGSGVVSSEDLGKICGQCAERLEHIHGLRSPDFYNKELFNGFIETLMRQKYIKKNPDGLLDIVDEFVSVEADARLILGEQVRHSILNITGKSAVTSLNETTKREPETR